MKIFKIKYFAASLVFHSALISLFVLYENPSEKAVTSMLVTEIIEIKETSKLNDVKKTNLSKTKIEDKIITKTKKSEEENIPIKVVLKSEGIPEKFKSSKLDNKNKNNDYKQATIENKKMEVMSSSNKKSNDVAISQNNNLSKAIYKIGSINNPHPPYPIIARKKGLQGKLILKVSINNDGSVRSVVVGKSSGHKILDKVSKETIEKWIFIPAKKMGQSVEDSIQVPIRFVLTE